MCHLLLKHHWNNHHNTCCATTTKKKEKTKRKKRKNPKYDCEATRHNGTLMLAWVSQSVVFVDNVCVSFPFVMHESCINWHLQLTLTAQLWITKQYLSTITNCCCHSWRLLLFNHAFDDGNCVSFNQLKQLVLRKNIVVCWDIFEDVHLRCAITLPLSPKIVKKIHQIMPKYRNPYSYYCNAYVSYKSCESVYRENIYQFVHYKVSISLKKLSKCQFVSSDNGWFSIPQNSPFWAKKTRKLT